MPGDDPLNKPMWPVGAFGLSSTPAQNLDQLQLSPEEKKVLLLLQQEYRRARIAETDADAAGAESRRASVYKLRGIKLALNEIVTTQDGRRQESEWQALLY